MLLPQGFESFSFSSLARCFSEVLPQAARLAWTAGTDSGAVPLELFWAADGWR